MRKGSMMGSSKYEFNEDQLDKDFAQREQLYKELLIEWAANLKEMTVKEAYEKAILFDKFSKAHKVYKERGYSFRFTFEGYQEKALLYFGKI